VKKFLVSVTEYYSNEIFRRSLD